MIPTEVLTEELLQQAAAELATALNDRLVNLSFDLWICWLAFCAIS